MVVVVAILSVKILNKNGLLQDLLTYKIIAEEKLKNFAENTQEQNKKLQFLEEQNSILTIYKGKLEQSEIILADIKLQNQLLKQDIEMLNSKILDYNKNNELLKQKQEILEEERKSWNIQKEVILHKLSEELIRKNSEEQNKFSQTQQENIKKTTEDLLKNFENVLFKVNSLNDDVKKANDEISLTKNSLLNPSGAGKTAEITLENILRSSGLREKINNSDAGDFILQSHFAPSAGNGKRPDALVFLPQNHILIIDSKSSSYFVDLQKSIDSKDYKSEREISSKIRDTMRKHLDDLKKKDYAKSKLEEIGLNNSNYQEMPVVTTVMFLQTEKMLEIVGRIDEEIEKKAFDANIYILSPIGLVNLLNQAKFVIDKIRQDENMAELKIQIKKIAESISLLFERASEIGDAIARSTKSYNKFISSFNNRFLPRIRDIGKLGIEFDGKDLGNRLNKIDEE